MARGIEHQHLTLASPRQLDHPRDAVGEHRNIRHHPHALADLQRAHTTQFTPHRHPMPRRLGRHPNHQHQPSSRRLNFCHDCECNRRYFCTCSKCQAGSANRGPCRQRTEQNRKFLRGRTREPARDRNDGVPNQTDCACRLRRFALGSSTCQTGPRSLKRLCLSSGTSGTYQVRGTYLVVRG